MQILKTRVLLVEDDSITLEMKKLDESFKVIFGNDRIDIMRNKISENDILESTNLFTQKAENIFSLPKEKRDFTMFNLLLNSIIMKAVVSGNSGGEKTRVNIKKCKDFLTTNYNELYQQLLLQHSLQI